MPSFTVYSDRVEINAPQQRVWQILYDLKRYPEWNPFTEKVVTSFKPGSPVELHVNLPGRGKRLQREFITGVKPPQSLGWGMNMLHDSILKARRWQTVEALADGRCCYHTEDHISGALSPLVKWLFYRSMRDGFNAMAYALKQRAEQPLQPQVPKPQEKPREKPKENQR